MSITVFPLSEASVYASGSWENLKTLETGDGSKECTTVEIDHLELSNSYKRRRDPYQCTWTYEPRVQAYLSEELRAIEWCGESGRR